MYTNVKKISLIRTQNQQGKQALSVSTEQQLLRGKIFSEDHHHIGGQPALSSSCSSELQDFVVQGFTARMPLLMATSVFGLGRRRCEYAGVLLDSVT